MMRSNKEFDCVEMKNAIQRRLQRRRRDMSTEEYIADVNKAIERSDSPAAEWWKRHQKPQIKSGAAHVVAR
jgi:hypothetical protein